MCYSLTGECTIIDRYAAYSTCNTYPKLQTPSSKASITRFFSQKTRSASMATLDKAIGIKARVHYMCWFWTDVAQDPLALNANMSCSIYCIICIWSMDTHQATVIQIRGLNHLPLNASYLNPLQYNQYSFNYLLPKFIGNILKHIETTRHLQEF